MVDSSDSNIGILVTMLVRSVTFFPINGPCKLFGETTPPAPGRVFTSDLISPTVKVPLTAPVG